MSVEATGVQTMVMGVYLRSERYFGCERNCFFHIFSSSAATAGGGLPIKVDLPF